MSNGVVALKISEKNTVKFESHESLRSTVALAREYARMNYPDRYVVFTDKRIIEGKTIKIRGKRRTVFKTEHGLYMSMILRPSLFPSQAGPLPPMAALALRDALSTYTDKELGIGWVGDIYCDGKMIGNVGVEGMLDNFSAYEYIIVSVSVSLSMGNFPYRLSDIMRKVFEDGVESVPMIMARAVLAKFFELYASIKTPDKFMGAYESALAIRGCKIKYLEGGKRRSVKVIGVNEKCELIAETREGWMFTISSPKKVILPKVLRRKFRRKRFRSTD